MRETIRFVCCVLGLVVGLSAECWGIHWLPPKVSGRASCSLLTMDSQLASHLHRFWAQCFQNSGSRAGLGRGVQLWGL